jgi:hypothetical protein
MLPPVNNTWASILGKFETLLVLVPASARLEISAQLLELAGEVRRKALADMGRPEVVVPLSKHIGIGARSVVDTDGQERRR